MHNLSAVLLHFCRSVLYVASRASVAGRVADKLHLSVLVPAERAFAVSQCPEAFSSRTGAVPITNDDSDLDWLFHILPHN
jgi:hypothetical protein